jgi:hypothetical protein
MNKENFLRRLLYAGAGLVAFVVIIFPCATILYLILDKTGNSTPGPATIGTIVIVMVHLLILYSFREALIVNKRNGHLANIVYIVSGIFLLIFGLIFLTMALEFLGGHSYWVSAISFCFCVGCDFLAAIIAFTAIFLQPSKNKN